MSRLYLGDCLAVLKTLPDNSVDSVVTDPPYGLRFMNRHWDYDVPTQDVWQEVLRVLKPGGHVLSFAGSRTYHRMVVAIEDAGFEVRDQIMWLYGSGFPKSLDVSKALDRMAGAEREVVATVRKTPSASSANMNEGWRRPWAEDHPKTMDITAPATEAAQRWAGWGTALKPAHEPICLARKPLIGTVADNVLAHRTGALNIDASRIPTEESLNGGAYAKNGSDRTDEWGAHNGFRRNQQLEYVQPQGRWPANLIHDGSDEVVGLFPDTGKSTGGRTVKRSGGGNVGSGKASEASWSNDDPGYGDAGSAARFFYCAKASRSDRGADNRHPTVKPTDLMRYLCRLITPSGGTVLDPFMGSGSTGKAAVLEGFDFIGIEREAEYLEIARARIAAVEQPAQMKMAV